MLRDERERPADQRLVARRFTGPQRDAQNIALLRYHAHQPSNVALRLAMTPFETKYDSAPQMGIDGVGIDFQRESKESGGLGLHAAFRQRLTRALDQFPAAACDALADDYVGRVIRNHIIDPPGLVGG